MSEVFERYCNDVCSQVRCKFFRPSIAAELTAHLEDHADGLIESGTDPETAASEAVAAMGDPVSVGRELDRLHSPCSFGWNGAPVGHCGAFYSSLRGGFVGS